MNRKHDFALGIIIGMVATMLIVLLALKIIPNPFEL